MSQSQGPESRGDRATFDRFLSAYWADFDAGRRRRLKEYFDLFPGIEDEIAREVVRIDDAAPADDDRERISVYRLDREVADGGQGRVYLAHHVHTGQRVALKLLRRENRFDVQSQMRMKREASALARLSHPGICAVYDLGEHEGSIFIAMQWIEGETMYRRIDRDRRAATESATPIDPAAQGGSFFIGKASNDRETTTRGALPPRPTSTERVSPPAPSDRRRPTAAIRSRPPGDVKEIADMFVEVCRAMHIAHEAGIVHRDLKPGNIMIRSDGRPVVIDFGLAAVEDAEPLTVQSQMLGTPSYMAPEQIVPTKDAPIDRQSDVFSLGIIFFELLTLHHPFDGVSRELRAQSIVRDEPLSLRSIGVSLGRDLEIVLRTALEKDRRRRYATAAEFADDIERALRKEPIRARRAGAVLRVTRWVQRNRAVAALLFIVVSTVGFAAVNAFLSSTRYRTLYESLLQEKRESRTTRIARAIDAGALASIRGRWTDAVAAYDEAESLGSEDFVTLGRGRVRAYLGRLDLASARTEILRLRQKFGSATFPGPLRLLEIETDRETAVDPELMRSRLKSLIAEGSLGSNDRAYVEARVAEDLEESRLLLEGVLAKDPWHQEAERYLAGVLAALGDGERLSALTIAASARRPEDPFCVVLRATKSAISGDCSAASNIMHELRGRVQTKELLIAESEVLSFTVPAALVDFALGATGVVDNADEQKTAELTAACQALDDVAGPPEVDAVLVREWSHLIRRAVFAPMLRFEELRAGKAIAPLASVATEFATSTRRLHNSAALALAAFYQSEDEVGLERSLALARESGGRPPVGRSRMLADMMAINALGALFVSATTTAPKKADAYLAQFPEAIRRYLEEKTGRCPVGIGTAMLRMAVRADDLDGALRFDAEWQKDGATVEQRLIEAERAVSKPGEIRRIFALVVAARILAEDPQNSRAAALRTRLMSEGAASAPSSSTDR